MTDFLNKEFVESYFYTDCNQDRYDSIEVSINDRPYIKFGTRTATTVVANLYKIWDASVKRNKFVALMGMSRQHPCDVKIDKEQGIELAHINALTNPIAQLTFDHKLSFQEILPIMEAYVNTLNKQFVKTRKEIIAEGKGHELASKKYCR